MASENPINPIFTPYFQDHQQDADEFGTVKYIEENNYSFAYSVYYPFTEVSYIDDDISLWLSQTLEQYALNADVEGKRLELNINYVSSSTPDGLVSIRFFGHAQEPYSAVSAAFSQSFIYAMGQDGVQLGLLDIFGEEQVASVKRILTAKAHTAGYEFVTSDRISNELLKGGLFFQRKSLSVTFPAGSFGSVQEDSIALSIPYGELEALFTEQCKGLIKSCLPYKLPVRQLDPNRPMVAITFDDGPSNRVTPRLLDLLDRYSARATFFMMGSRLEKHELIVKDVSERGHEIGCHTWAHEDFKKQSPDEIKNSITSMTEMVYDMTGQRVTFVRPPYGSYDDRALEISRELDMPFALWSIDSLDWKSKDAQAVFQLVKDEVQDGAVLLFHDLYDSTYEAMELLIPYLVEQGYQIVTMTELFTYSDRAIAGGEKYYKR